VDGRPREQLSAFADTYEGVEIEWTVYSLPRVSTAERWRREADASDPDFTVTARALRATSHPISSPTCRDEARPDRGRAGAGGHAPAERYRVRRLQADESGHNGPRSRGGSPARHPLVSTAATCRPTSRRFVDAIDGEAEPAPLAERLAALAADHERVCCLFDNGEMDDNAARPGELLE